MFSSSKRFSVNGSTGSVRSVKLHSPTKASAKSSASKETANLFGAFGLGGLVGNSGMNVHATGPMASVNMLTYLVPEQEASLRTYYRDIYYYDPVCGAAIDLLSSFPFSDFTLTGVNSKLLEKYNESMARLNVRSLMPDISTGFLVDGQFIASLIFNIREKLFVDLIVYNADDCKIDKAPFYSADPSIVVRRTEAMAKFMAADDPQARAVRQTLPTSFIRALNSPAFRLDPLTALYLERKTLPGAEPISFLKRVLPIYLLEKTLYRGTLVEAMKRQRSMLHVQMGDDTHEFTPEEMAETVNQFQLADLDPLGAVIGTRNNVQASELRQGGDFWKVTDTYDILTPYKLRALGISEAFLSGDSNYSNVETALSVFMENADAYRSFLTFETFTNKIFPIVAIYNGFYKPGKEQHIKNRAQLVYQANNFSDLETPQLHWHKRLSAKDEDNVMDTLSTLEEKGFPIPLRMWAAAGKVDINAYYQDLEQDSAIRARIADLTKGKATNGNEEEDFLEAATLKRLTSGVKRVPLLARDFGNSSGEVTAESKTGKRKAIYNQKKATAELNKKIAKAVSALADPNVRRTALNRVKAKTGRVPNLAGVPLRGR